MFCVQEESQLLKVSIRGASSLSHLFPLRDLYILPRVQNQTHTFISLRVTCVGVWHLYAFHYLELLSVILLWTTLRRKGNKVVFDYTTTILTMPCEETTSHAWWRKSILGTIHFVCCCKYNKMTHTHKIYISIDNSSYLLTYIENSQLHWLALVLPNVTGLVSRWCSWDRLISMVNWVVLKWLLFETGPLLLKFETSN